jgi:hypothetical protein
MKDAGMRKAMMVAVLSGVSMWMACSTAWISEAEQIVAALIPAVGNLVTLAASLPGNNVSPADLETIQKAGAQTSADLQLMQSLIQQYPKADAAAQPGLLGQTQVAMSAAQSILNGLLPALHIKDAATEAKITAVVGIMLSEVESAAAIVPLVDAGASPKMMTLSARQANKQPPLSAREFIDSYNATMTAKTGSFELDHATAKLRIHGHGRFARWVSAGLLK